jgi:hypothetical protein
MSEGKQVQNVPKTALELATEIANIETIPTIKFNDPEQEGCEFDITKCERIKTKMGSLNKTSMIVYVKYLNSDDGTLYKGFLPQKYADTKMNTQQVAEFNRLIMTVDKVIRIGNNLNGTPKYTPKLTFREKDKQLELE